MTMMMNDRGIIGSRTVALWRAPARSETGDGVKTSAGSEGNWKPLPTTEYRIGDCASVRLNNTCVFKGRDAMRPSSPERSESGANNLVDQVVRRPSALVSRDWTQKELVQRRAAAKFGGPAGDEQMQRNGLDIREFCREVYHQLGTEGRRLLRKKTVWDTFKPLRLTTKSFFCAFSRSFRYQLPCI